LLIDTSWRTLFGIMGQGNRHFVLWIRRPSFDNHVARTATVLIRVICCVAAFLVVPGLLVTSAQAQQRRPLPRHVPPEAAQLPPVDRLPGSTRLDLAIGLPLRNQDMRWESCQPEGICCLALRFHMAWFWSSCG